MYQSDGHLCLTSLSPAPPVPHTNPEPEPTPDPYLVPDPVPDPCARRIRKRLRVIYEDDDDYDVTAPPATLVCTEGTIVSKESASCVPLGACKQSKQGNSNDLQ